MSPPMVMAEHELLTSQRGTDGRWHALYPSASKTLCGRAAVPAIRGRRWPPDCGRCARIARAFHRIDGSCPPHWLLEADAA